MRDLIKFEWKRCLRTKGFRASLALAVLLILLDGWSAYQLNRTVGSMTKYPDIFLYGWIGLDYQFVYRGIFFALLPIMAALPFGGSYDKDSTTGYIKNLRLVSSGRQYHFVKYIVTFFMGALVIAIPMLLSMALAMTYMPILPPEPFAFQECSDKSFLTACFYTNPVLYAILISITDGLFGGVLAVFSLCITNYVHDAFSVLVLPFMVYMLSEPVCRILGLDMLSYYILADPMLLCGKYVVPMLCLGILVTFCWYVLYEARKDVL